MKKFSVAVMLSCTITTSFAQLNMQCPEAYQIQYLPVVKYNHFYMAIRYIPKWHEMIVFRTQNPQKFQSHGILGFLGATYVPKDTMNVPAEIACYYRGLRDPVWMYTERTVDELQRYSWSKQQYGEYNCRSHAPADCPFMIE